MYQPQQHSHPNSTMHTTPKYGWSYKAPTQFAGVSQYEHSSGYNSDGNSSVRSDDSISSVTIVPKQRNEADGYNQYSKTPSGNLRHTVGGQTIELFEGTHEGVRRDALGYPIWS